MDDCKNMDMIPKDKSFNDIKSTAIVKYTSASIPLSTGFSRLRLNTNLNVPPSNWLRSSSGMERYIRDYTWKKEHSEFSSIRMANNFPDLTGEVDVVSGSQSIKKLLKMPLCKSSHVSMMVHRIGKTLLLDEFDIHKLLLRNQEEEWTWLRHFFYSIVAKDMQGKMKCIPRQSKSRNTLEKRNMYSKFLYHSLVATCNPNELVWQTQPNPPSPPTSHREPLELVPDPLPKPESEFDREILWKFEDIHMLIGSDLPIFGGATHPCVSLRLRDSKTPINVLTGLDYWLDNLMCNVPEVAMCFHLNGIVQKYELIKTEDIPNLDDCKFDPQLVIDIARNILSFLKSNATKEGHTYWLYKNVDDDVVKLYDLTALCEEKEDRRQNPFTVPVGILLYRVARNMRQTTGRRNMSTIRALLENSLLLLDDSKHCQVCTSANYLLSDLYVPDCSVHDVWSVPDSESESDESEDSPMSSDDENDARTEISVGMNDLVNKSYLNNRVRRTVKSHHIAGTVEERCHDALKHIRKGLECLYKEKTENNMTKNSSSIVEEQVPCNQNQAIPLHYQPLKSTSSGGQALEVLRHKSKVPMDKPWQCLSNALLMRKSSMTYFALAKAHLSAQKYGNALKYVRFAVHCFEAMSALIPSKGDENKELFSLILELAGDIRLVMGRISNGFEEHGRDYDNMSEDEAAILDCAKNVVSIPELDWVYVWTLSMEQNLVDSSRCYEQALCFKDTKVGKEARIVLTKRLGNSMNELGVWYMNQAQVYLQSGTNVPLEKMEELWENSGRCFDKGIEAFSSVGDRANQALLHSNKGRLKRLCAQCYTQKTLQKERPEFSAKERQYYLKAIDCYQRALDVLQCADKSKLDRFLDIRESVKWDLSSTYFNMAMLLQDYAPLSTQPQDEIEKQVTDLMNKSLKYCTTDEKRGRDLTMQQYRAATINHRLASLYHNSYRNQEINDQKRRHLRQLADHHYDRALKHFYSVEAYSDLLRVQLERVAMQELFYESQTSLRGKLRCLQTIFVILCSCKDIIVPMSAQFDDTSNDSIDQPGDNNLYSILLSRIQFDLLQLIKTYKIMKSHCESILKDLKRFYAKSLQSEGEKVNCLKERWKRTADFLSELSCLQDQLAREAA